VLAPSLPPGRDAAVTHTHPGPVIIKCRKVKLKITQGTCHPNVVGAGETYIETAALPVLATANKAAKWTATLIVPVGAPLEPM
jgi:hypothetical protein